MKRMKKLLVLMLALTIAAGLLAGCGNRKPTENDARKYVKAVMDILATGDYDHSVRLVDVEDAQKTHEDILDVAAKQLADNDQLKLSEETVKHFRDVMDKALHKSKYTIGNAVAAGDGYDVTVTIEPLVVLVDSAKLSDDIMDYLLSLPDVESMSQEQLMSAAMGYYIDCIEQNVENPAYSSPVDVTVHYGKLDNGLYGVSEEGGRLVGEKLFAVN